MTFRFVSSFSLPSVMTKWNRQRNRLGDLSNSHDVGRIGRFGRMVCDRELEGLATGSTWAFSSIHMNMGVMCRIMCRRCDTPLFKVRPPLKEKQKWKESADTSIRIS